jgi:uncharacterized membrane protein YcaP (DUF421 family)
MSGVLALGSVVTAQSTHWHEVFGFGIPPAEKIVRTVVVYLAIALLLRIAGKRQMAQLNTLDLVVVLLLSNVVQNAVIGPDNSLLGGLLGAVVLVTFNAVFERVAVLNDSTTRWFEGTTTSLVEGGIFNRRALRRTGLTEQEVEVAVRHQGADSMAEVESARLEPGGVLTVRLRREDMDASYGELVQVVADLQRHLDARLDALEAASGRPT